MAAAGRMNTGRDGRTRTQPLHRWVHDVALSGSTHLAVRDGLHTLTYAELDAHANALAHRLRALGVRPGARVGLCHQRSAVSVIGAARDTQGGRSIRRTRPRLPRRPARLHAP